MAFRKYILYFNHINAFKNKQSINILSNNRLILQKIQ